jgi:hypothetical protein
MAHSERTCASIGRATRVDITSSEVHEEKKKDARVEVQEKTSSKVCVCTARTSDRSLFHKNLHPDSGSSDTLRVGVGARSSEDMLVVRSRGEHRWLTR